MSDYDFEQWTCPIPLRDSPHVVLGHGGGGKLSAELVEHLFLPAFNNQALSQLGDSAVVEASGRLALSTDSFVVQPRFFPGGNIGELAVYGTVNDVSMSGAVPKFMAVSFILEEGLPIRELGVIVESMARAAERAGVAIVTGDTKVVDKGHGDGVFITTTGIGVIPEGIEIGPDRIRPGDKAILSGTVGDHGMAIMSVREGLGFEAPILSDTAPLNHLIETLLAERIEVRALRDPTRGGLAATLNELAQSSRVGILIDEKAVPIRRAVDSACEMLGMDPFQVANEGKFVALVASSDAEKAVSVLRGFELGENAVVIGEAVSEHPGMVVAKTAIGSSRVVDTQVGEQLPRIC